MKRILLLIILSFFFLSSSALADCRGCCSGHGGTQCKDGVTVCKDGSEMTDKCQKKCQKCNNREIKPSSKPPAPQSVSAPNIPLNKRGNTKIESFSKAKKLLLREVYKNSGKTFYCECPFEGKLIKPCDNFTARKKSDRAKRLEWEHIVPAHQFGQSFKEWREGHSECTDSKGKSFKGRKCAEKRVIPFRFMQSDMYNLVPAIGSVNGRRSNFRFGMIAGEKKEYGGCDMEIDTKARIAEPPMNVRGQIARTYKYMEWAYPKKGIIGKASKKLFDAWDKLDPVDAWECERCKIIEAIQGNENPFVKEPCEKAGLW